MLKIMGWTPGKCKQKRTGVTISDNVNFKVKNPHL